MAAQCVSNLEAAVKAVKDEYGNDPKWQSVIDHAEKAVTEAQAAEGTPAPESPGQKAASDVHNQVNNEKAVEAKEDPKEEATETPIVEKKETSQEVPVDLKGASKIALLMLRKK